MNTTVKQRKSAPPVASPAVITRTLEGLDLPIEIPNVQEDGIVHRAPRFHSMQEVYYRGEAYVYAQHEGQQFIRIERIAPDALPGELAKQSFCVPEVVCLTTEEYLATLPTDEEKQAAMATKEGKKKSKLVEDQFPDVEACVAHFAEQGVAADDAMREKLTKYMTAPNNGVKKMRVLNLLRYQLKLKGEKTE